MPQLNGGGGDDLGANDELISFKDEGEQEEKNSENSSAERDLADVKSSLVNESETNQNSSSDSEVGRAPRAGGWLQPVPGPGERGWKASEARRVGLAGGADGGPGCWLRKLVTVFFCTPFSADPPFPHPLGAAIAPRPPHLAPPGRRKDGLRLAPKVSEINPGKVWKKRPRGKMEGSLRGHRIPATPSS